MDAVALSAFEERASAAEARLAALEERLLQGEPRPGAWEPTRPRAPAAPLPRGPPLLAGLRAVATASPAAADAASHAGAAAQAPAGTVDGLLELRQLLLKSKAELEAAQKERDQVRERCRAAG
jgi:hypothetical protein